MDHQRPRTWTARLGIAALCGLLVALVSLVGYEPNPRNAGAAIQPAPTSIAFVPMHPEPAQVRALQAGRMLSLPEPAELRAPAGGPEPAGELLPDADACSFPCFDPEAAPEPPAKDEPAEEEPAEETD